MTVADVPVTELAGLRCRGQDLIPRGDLSAHCSPTALLLDHEFGVVCQDQGQIGLSGFVHVASMGQNGKESKGPGPVPRLSHPVQEVCHRFLVLFIGCEPIREASGNLTGCRLDRREIPTLGQDVGLVGVGSGFVHADIIDTGGDGSWVQVDSLPTVRDPSLLE